MGVQSTEVVRVEQSEAWLIEGVLAVMAGGSDVVVSVVVLGIVRVFNWCLININK